MQDTVALPRSGYLANSTVYHQSRTSVYRLSQFSHSYIRRLGLPMATASIDRLGLQDCGIVGSWDCGMVGLGALSWESLDSTYHESTATEHLVPVRPCASPLTAASAQCGYLGEDENGSATGFDRATLPDVGIGGGGAGASGEGGIVIVRRSLKWGREGKKALCT